MENEIKFSSGGLGKRGWLARVRNNDDHQSDVGLASRENLAINIQTSVTEVITKEANECKIINEEIYTQRATRRTEIKENARFFVERRLEKQLARELERERHPPTTPRLIPITDEFEWPTNFYLPEPLIDTYARVFVDSSVADTDSNFSDRSSEAETIILIPEITVSVSENEADNTMMNTASASPEASGRGVKPLTYTTVGSVVKADETPNFAPPVRIHREGANRRPSASFGQNRNNFDSHPSRTHPQNFRPSHALVDRSNYTLMDQGPFRDIPQYSTSNNIPPLDLDSISTSLSQDEHSTLHRLPMPRARSAEARSLPRTSLTAHLLAPLTNIANIQNQDVVESTEELDMTLSDAARRRGISVPPATMTGLNPLNKMQSLQRLSQYPNPMQDMAKNRLAEFSISRSQAPTKENMTPRELPPLVHVPPNKGRTTNTGKDLIMALEKFDPKGELEMNYRCPNPIPTQQNDMQGGSSGARSPSTASTTTNTYQPATTKSYPQTQQGYPKPLTAGPPRQRLTSHSSVDITSSNSQGRSVRQNGDISRQALRSLQEIVERHAKKDDERSKELDDEELLKQLRKHAFPASNATPDAIASNSPWNDINANQRVNVNNTPNPKVYDTSTPADIHKYYNGGLPSNYNYERPPSPVFPPSAATFDCAFLNPQIIPDQTRTAPANPWTKAGAATVATSHQNWFGAGSKQPTGGPQGTNNPTDSWWYSGLRRVGMTAEEHVQEFENKKWRFENGYPEPIPPPGTATDHKPFTKEQIDKMEVNEMMTHLLNPTFGTLLSIADPNPGPAASFNLFRPTEERYRDPSAQGNMSLFGEDWGVTPGQIKHQQNLETVEKAKEATDRYLINNPPKPVQPEWKIAAAEGRKEGRQLWKKAQNTEPTWIGPHGFAKERGLDEGRDTADLVDFEKGGIMKGGITIPPRNPNKKPVQRVGTAIVPPTKKITKQVSYAIPPGLTPSSVAPQVQKSVATSTEPITTGKDGSKVNRGTSSNEPGKMSKKWCGN